MNLIALLTSKTILTRLLSLASNERKDEMKNVFRLFMILCMALAGTAIFAQDLQTKGSVGGTVTDSNGGILPNAKVTVEGQQTNVSTQTNDQGVYKVESLLPGTYTVTVEQAGFK